MSFTINISIDQQGIASIQKARKYVTIVQQVESSLGIEGLPVAWLVVPPMEKIVIEFGEDYFLYASEAVLAPGMLLKPFAQTESPAQEGWVYTLNAQGFSGASGAGTTYNVLSQLGQVVVGLAQSAKIDGAPSQGLLNANNLANNQTLSFTPQLIFQVFLYSHEENGTILQMVPGDACRFTLTAEAPTVDLVYNDNHGIFSVGS